MTSLLILTVGTGTAGKHSNLAQGLINTLTKAKARLFWLVPSTHPDSVELANLVRDGGPEPGTFQRWSDEAPFRCIADPDDIYDCRAALREVLAAARKQLRQGERLIVNPTSGTKQMSAGATVAALEEGIGEIVFTVGERADGVVKTGTERLAPFSTEAFFLERDLRMADELFRHGAFSAAGHLLRGYRQAEAIRARETALCLHEWQRMNYAKAASYAAKFSEELRVHLKNLADADEFGVTVLGDLLAGADELLNWGDCEEALARYYRGAEQAAKVRLAEAHGIRPPYRLEALFDFLPAGCRLAAEVRSNQRNGIVFLAGQKAWEALETARDPMAAAYFADRKLQEGLQRRNDSMYGHGRESVEPGHVREVANKLRTLLREHLPIAADGWSTVRRPRGLIG